MKKILAIILASIMLFAFVACDSGSDHKDDDDTKSSGNEDKVESKDDDGTKNDDDSDGKNDTDAFSEYVAVENDECKITVKKIDSDSRSEYTINLLFENKSSDKTYMFSAEKVSVNGVQYDPFFATEVAAGKKDNSKIVFSDTDLNKLIGEFTDIEITFSAYDSDDWAADYVLSETIHIYPLGEDKATAFVRESRDSDNVIIDNDYISVTVIGSETNEYGEYVVNLFLENKGDKDLMITAEDVSVNGFMADPYYGETLYAGNSVFSSMYWNESELSDNDITDVEEIEFIFKAIDDNDWLADDYVNEKITINP